MAAMNSHPRQSDDDLGLPELFASIPRSPLTLGPSPIHALPNISAALGGKVSIYAKREDLNSALAFGGNKTRKLEYLIPDALAQNCDTLVSIGGFQSNHTRQVAAVAAKSGLKCKLVQEKWVDHDDVGYDKVGNIQLSRLMRADVRLDQSGFGIEHKQTLKRLEEEVLAGGGKPYYIPAGASDHPLGGLGFARWAFEVYAQERQLNVFFDTIIVCAVTGSTFAGMIAGFKLLERTYPAAVAAAAPSGKKRKIIGIDASAKPKETFDQVLRIARDTAAKIGLKASDISEADVILDERYHAGTYGLADAATLDAIRFGAQTEAFITDPVYEGKSLAGLIDMVRRGEIEDGSNVLYAHLGGQLALNAYSDIQ
ncbi:1-aminocyclopropane-1-carboxylate deaminase [Phialophora macrospora]|uniref:1-aminocyclopropane-1-carboxylate deaminase n=1 Tax=Phialophora macrospora TaxID=1851006 RepID=A0A0D2FUN9_9EURO|nr:1-aminocyclopropane-1-carboxylate deaminase [Phialophora macrospora]